MVGELVMLPVRVGVRATRLWFRAVEETVSVTGRTTGRLIELIGSRGAGGATGGSTLPREPVDAVAPSGPVQGFNAPAQAAPPPVADTPPAPATDPAPAAAPAHVSEEPTLVEQFAEPGAEDGAGAEVHVDPPWDGYERMTAKEIIARLNGADAAELAAVELYEATSRRRQTIINAVERELRRVNGNGSRRNPQRG
jgi:hypothetical protein